MRQFNNIIAILKMETNMVRRTAQQIIYQFEMCAQTLSYLAKNVRSAFRL